MRNLLLVAGIVVLALPLFSQCRPTCRQVVVPGASCSAGVAAAVRWVRVDALGQEVKRPPVPTGPAPRLPDGTIDLNGVWVGGGPVNDIAQGLPKGETLPLLPSAIKLMESAAQHTTDDPHLWCMPMGVPRSTPYPFRFVQNYTHKAPTHIFILHEANIHSYRQIFMDGRKHPAELDPTWFGHSIGSVRRQDTLVIDTVGFNDKFWFDRKGHAAHRATAHDRTMDATEHGHTRQQRHDR